MVEASFLVRFCSASSRQICKLRLSSNRVSRFSSSRPSWYSNSACWIRTSMLLRHAHCLVINYSRDRTLHVYKASAFWCPLTSVNREENQEIPIPTALCHGIQEICKPHRVGSFLQTDVCSVSSTCPAQQMVYLLILGTRADWKHLEGPSKTWFKNMFVLVYCSLK